LKEQIAFPIGKVKELESMLHAKKVDGQPNSTTNNMKDSCMLLS